MVVSQKALSEHLIENTWYCFSKDSVGEFEYYIEDEIDFTKGGKYSLSTSVEFIGTNARKSKLISSLDGNYSYSDGILKYKEVRSIDIQIKSDDLDMLTPDSIENLKDMLNQNSKANYKTVKLTNETWVSQNSISNEKVVCHTTRM
jgi:hypothetical protein